MENYVVLFGIKFNINPVAFTLPIGDGWSVYWYGIIIALGFLAAVVYGYLMAKKMEINIDRMLDVVLVTTPIAILCARAYYVIFDSNKITSIKGFFGLDGSGFSGLAIYGGVIGAFVCGFIMCKLRKVNYLDMFDLAAVGFILAQGIGRWGNFVNQEAYGIETGSSWWGMSGSRIGDELVHPCFLYESVWCIAGFFLLDYIIRHRKFKGQTFLAYCIWYGFMRGFLELIRTDSLMLGSIRVSSVLSFAICIAGLALTFKALNKIKVNANETAYVPMFTDASETEEVLEAANEESDEENIGDTEGNSSFLVEEEENTDEQAD